MNVAERGQVGEKLPKGWKWIEIEKSPLEIIDGDRGKNYPKQNNFSPSGYCLFLNTGNVTSSGFDFSNCSFISQEVDTILRTGKLQFNDVVLTTRGTIGNTAWLDETIPYSILRINSGMVILRVDAKKLFPGFLCQFIRSPQFREQIQSLQSGSAQPQLPIRDLKRIRLPFPPLPEQKRIVAILTDRISTIDKARAATEVQLKAAKALPAAYLRQVFDSPEARKWKRSKLGDIALISGGLQKTPNRSPSSFHRSYLTVRNVQRGWLDLSAVERFEITLGELERCRLKRGDLLIVEGNGSVDHIGRNAIYQGEPEDCIHQNHLIRVRLDQTRNDPNFLSFYLNSDFGKKQMLEKAMSTTGLHTLSVSKIQQMEAPIVSLEEQRRITSDIKEMLSTVTKLEQSLQSQLDTINKLPAALLRQAFNGEL